MSLSEIRIQTQTRINRVNSLLILIPNISNVFEHLPSVFVNHLNIEKRDFSFFCVLLVIVERYDEDDIIHFYRERLLKRPVR